MNLVSLKMLQNCFEEGFQKCQIDLFVMYMELINLTLPVIHHRNPVCNSHNAEAFVMPYEWNMPDVYCSGNWLAALKCVTLVHWPGTVSVVELEDQ